MIADYAKNDVNFVLSVLSLEELGARGNKGLAGLVDNPVHSAAIAGLATSATAQATVEVREALLGGIPDACFWEMQKSFEQGGVVAVMT